MDFDDSDRGVAGESARREHARRQARREQAVRERHPRLAGLLLALREPPPHERSWRSGAEGEAMVAEALEKRCREEVVVLHDRRVPRSRANIDHIAIAPSGVWVIDTKRYKGRVRINRPLFGQPKLTIAGRDRTKLIDGLETQVELLKPVVSEWPDVKLRGALCFVDADLPLLEKLELRGCPVLHRRGLAKRLNADGSLNVDQIAGLTARLAAAFPPA